MHCFPFGVVMTTARRGVLVAQEKQKAAVADSQLVGGAPMQAQTRREGRGGAIPWALTQTVLVS